MNAIQFTDVSKRFTLHREKRNSFQERLVNILRPRGAGETFWALKNVSFELPQGETLGLIGHNGSGKSTSLKLITRILEPTSGKVTVRGRVSALLELGSGFHPDLTGIDNIYLNGSLLGFSRADMRKRANEIVDFAELGPFIETPVKHYSSGMYMRLGFAIATAVDPDILITDEVLAVGDEAFQRKCMERIYQFRNEGRTIVFVSHSLDVVRSLCTTGVWLDHGEVKFAGNAMEAVDAYLRHTNQQEQVRIEREHAEVEMAPPPMEQGTRWGSREIEIERVALLDEQGRETSVFHTGAPMTIRMYYNAHQPITDPSFGIGLYHASGFHINGPNSRFGGLSLGTVTGRGYVDYAIGELPLLTGNYLLTVAVYDSTLTHPYDHQQLAYSFVVQTNNLAERWGSFYIPARWNWKQV